MNTTQNKKITKKSNKKVVSKKVHEQSLKRKHNYNGMLIATLLVGVLLIVSTYAWFSSTLNVNVKFVNMIVSNNNGLYISLDGVDFKSSIEISQDILINKLKQTYPSNTSQWAGFGLHPVSSVGILDPNHNTFDLFTPMSYTYSDKKKTSRLLTVAKDETLGINPLNTYVAFDLFLKNVTGSPMPDNLYLDTGTAITVDSKISEEMQGLVNSLRIGFLKLDSVPLKSDVKTIQNITCNNNCTSAIYEPNSTLHTDLSHDRIRKYGINLKDGTYYPTYAMINNAKNVDIRRGMYGMGAIDTTNFRLQETVTNFKKPLFKIPNAITKVRVYIWLEGQDIDSIETRSWGTNINIRLNFIKDTAGYDYYND